MATAAHATTPDFPFFPSSSNPLLEQQLSSFLHRPVPLTILPQLSPEMQEKLGAWYPDSEAVGMTGIIDACLHNLYDVPRAWDVFSRLRKKAGNHLLTTPLYNTFLEAYVGMAQKSADADFWILEAWKLYDVLELGTEGVLPNAKTYSIMLFLWHQYVLSHFYHNPSDFCQVKHSCHSLGETPGRSYPWPISQ
jgi:DNA-directed RNA polymerase